MGWRLFQKKQSSKLITLQGSSGQYSYYPGKRNLQLNRISKFSKAYLGTNNLGQHVVIKVLNDEIARNTDEVLRFMQETQWNKQHDNLLAPFEYLFHDGRHYLISDYFPCIHMGEYIKRRWIKQSVRVNTAVECGLQLLDAIEVIHKKEMIHTDIKPSNVLMLRDTGWRTKQLQFRLIDFGMVRPVGFAPQKQLRKGELPFALVFAPPEQVLGFYELMGFHSDLYNIALLIYEIITGEPVYQTDLTVKLINLQTSFPLPDTKLIPTELQKILKKAAAKYHFRKPPNHYKRDEVFHMLKEGISHRYTTATEFKNDLIQFWLNYQK